MPENSIVDEVHRTRAEILAEFNGDLRAYAEDLQRRTEAAAAAGKHVIPMPPRPVTLVEVPKTGRTG